MTATWTIRALLTWMARDFTGHELASPRLDAELIVAHVLGLDRVQLYMDLERPLTAAELSEVRALVVRRRQREPVAYLTGKREFYRRDFEVSKAVLIPRPDTECLVERALSLLASKGAATVLDLCTGSGAIAVTLAAERPSLQLTATDISPAALELAERNAHRHGVSDRVRLRSGDLFGALSEPARFDLIVANPPYIVESDLSRLAPELRHEPSLALIAGEDGLDVLRRLCEDAPNWLAEGGALLFEVGMGQADAVVECLQKQARLTRLTTHKDLGAVVRVVEAHVLEVPLVAV